MNRSTLPALFGAALLLAPTPGRAHGIESSLDRLGPLSSGFDPAQAGGERLQLASRFSNGLPAREASVRLVPPGAAGSPIELGRTDAEGRLTFTLPAQASLDWEIQVDAGPGHRDYLELPGRGRSVGTDHARVPWSPASVARGLSPFLLFGLIGGIGLLRRHRGRA
jgi:nickel transport protein